MRQKSEIQLLANLAYQMCAAAEEQVEIKGALLKLLHMIIANIGELSVDDNWLKGQIDGLLAAAAPPLTLRHLDEMERRLRDVMERQGRAKSRSVEAQAEMRPALARLADPAGGTLGLDDATRLHIRNLDLHLQRLNERTEAGFNRMTDELRAEIRLLARTIAAMAEDDRQDRAPQMTDPAR